MLLFFYFFVNGLNVVSEAKLTLADSCHPVECLSEPVSQTSLPVPFARDWQSLGGAAGPPPPPTLDAGCEEPGWLLTPSLQRWDTSEPVLPGLPVLACELQSFLNRGCWCHVC